MENIEKNTPPTTDAQNENGKLENSKKYNFYRKPSIKKKVPEVKQTLTSYRRMLKANPLLKYEMEGKDLSLLNKQLSSSSSNQNKGVLDKISSKKLQPNSGKTLVSNLQRTQSLRNPPKYQTSQRKLTTVTSTIISGNKPKTSTNINNIDVSKQSSVDFNTSTSRFLCSTKLENTSSRMQKKHVPVKPSVGPKTVNKSNCLTQDNCISSSGTNAESNCKKNEKRIKPIRRSLSAQHFDRKKGHALGHAKIVPEMHNACFNRVDLTQSLSDISNLRPVILPHDISPIPERSQEEIIFKTPSAYERRSIARFTPRSVVGNRRSVYQPTTPLPSLHDLQKRLNDWLTRRGKNPSSFCNLKYFGIQDKQKNELVDDENKENVEVDQDLGKGSYEDLKIAALTNVNVASTKNEKPVELNEDNKELVARAALDDLLKLIQEGYSRPQCEGWLELIRQNYRKLEEEPLYWECRAAIEQSRGNLTNAVHCYRTAIVQGAEIQAVDESLDVLLQKFSLLNISTDTVENEKTTRERARIVQDARKIFKSSIIQFAVQERKLKHHNKGEDKSLVATPVRRSTRLSRKAYTSTPGVKICSSLQELDSPDRIIVDFKKNKALF